MTKTRLIIALAVLIALVSGFLLTRRDKAAVLTYQTAEAGRQTIRQTVSATGTIQPLTTVDIKSRAGGEVKELPVEVGTFVKPGTLIARIDPTDSLTAFNQAEADVSAAAARVGQARDTLALQRLSIATAVADAEAQVRAAQARLTQAEQQARVQPSLTESAIRQAQAGLRRSQQSLAQLRAAGNPQSRAQAQAALQTAEANLRNAEQNLRRQEQLLAKGFVAEATVDAARTERDVAQAQAEQARARQQTIGAEQSGAVAVADAQVSEARSTLRSAETGRVQVSLRQQDVASARAALSQARTALQAARANAAQAAIRAADIQTARAQTARSEAQLKNARVQLDSTTIRAPRAGVILQRYVEQGTIITSGQSFNSVGTSIVQIGDLSRVFVDANVDEADIAQLKVGQKVNVTLDAYPDDSFEGRIRRIDPRGTTDQNVTIIKTQVEITKTDPRLRPGLNAECEFVIAEAKDVIAVPARAVKEKNGKKVVEVLAGEKPETREVKTGIEGGDLVQIVSGLKEGEKVVTQTIRPGEDKNARGGGGRPGGGGRGGGPGGLSGGGGGFGR